jgi:hypothetical protein
MDSAFSIAKLFISPLQDFLLRNIFIILSALRAIKKLHLMIKVNPERVIKA